MKRFLRAITILALTVIVFAGCAKKEAAAKPAAVPAAAPAAVEKTAVAVKTEERKVKPDYTIRMAFYDAATLPDMSKTPLPEYAYALVFKSIVESKIAWRVFDQSQFWKNMSSDFEKKTGMQIISVGRNGSNSAKPS